MQSVANDYSANSSEDSNMWHDAVRVVIENRKASTSLLQRRLRIGYGRAARLIEAMEEQGIVGLADGSRPREVLIHSIAEAGIPNAQSLPPPPKKTAETVEEYISELETDDAFQELSARYGSWIKTFFSIAERKVAVLDEYGDEDWDALYNEIATILYKIYKQERAENRPAGFFDTASYLNAGSMLHRFTLMARGDKQIANLGLYLEVKFKQHYKDNTDNIGKRSVSMSFDNLTGRQFEGFIAKLLKGLGYSDIAGTPITGDQGADIVATKNGRTVLVQAKRYYKPVGNSAVQEIVGALKFYNGDDGWVITNSTFTPGARSLAQKNNIRLTDGQDLSALMLDARSQHNDNLIQG